MRKITLIALPILFTLSVVCTFHHLIIDFIPVLHWFADLFWLAFVLFPLWSMFRQGSFRRSNLIRGAYFGVALIFIGSLFKMQHWPNAMFLLFTGCSVVAVFYVIHFAKKPVKELFDWLKVLYVLMAAVALPSRFGHYAWMPVISWLQITVSTALVGVFYFRTWKDSEGGFPELSDDDENVFHYSK